MADQTEACERGKTTRAMKRRVIIVDGPLALGMRRFRAAKANEVGLEILSLPLLAARLAGGFRRIADREILSAAVTKALRADGYSNIEEVKHLPGMVRAALLALGRSWDADLDLKRLAPTSERIADLALLERRVSEALPPGAMLPRPLRDAAVERVHFAAELFGSISLECLVDVEPLWQPLLIALSPHLDISWSAPATSARDWFAAEKSTIAAAPPKLMRGELCADPRAEVVEALRWARQLLSNGASADEIAITAASTPSWDEHMLVLAGQAEMPIHFSHGLPALGSWEGQSCAALADVLGNGLSQERVRRLLAHASSTAAAALPTDWASGLPHKAGLFTMDHWRRALRSARDRRSDSDAAEKVLLPLLETLVSGLANAEKAGAAFLGGASLGLWRDALRNAPPAAIVLSLDSLRIRDSRHPANSIAWCPASHLIGAPRRWMRLLGVAGRSWPRSESEDPLLPDHVLPRRRLMPISIAERDRRCFELLLSQPAEEIVLSRSRRSTEGALQSPSALWPTTIPVRICARARIPEHAFSEADRLLARAAEAGRTDRIRTASSCWRNWNREDATAHDGMVRAGHPAVRRAVEGLHSPTSLRLMVRDPLGFIWRYALDMRPVAHSELPLALDPLAFGELVHELLARTIAALEPAPGFVRASRDEIEIALADAVEHVSLQWPLERPVPPTMLWTHSLEEASRRSLRGLTVDTSFEVDTTSWTEVGFGQRSAPEDARSPWPLQGEIYIGSSKLKLGGRIDRVDLAAGGRGVRISDYKTGATPRRADKIVLDRGRELQRVLYAIAVKQLVPDASQIVSRLIYLDGVSPPFALSRDTLERAADDVGRFLDKARELLEQGQACPGPEAREAYNEMRLALPADLDGYLARKAKAIGLITRGLDQLWSAP